MPIANDPAAHYDYILEGDRDKDPAPVFVLRHLTCRQWHRAIELEGEFKQAHGVGEQLETGYKVVGLGLGGWRDMTGADGEAIPFDLEALPDLVTLGELTELMQAVLAQAIDPEDKKKSESPSPSNTAESATTAPAPESVETDQPQPSP